jgi:hypothetical protein
MPSPSATAETPIIPLKKRRDLGIDAVIRRIILCHFPDLSECEIQARGSMEIGNGRYMVNFDNRAIAIVELEAEDRFRITIL